MKYRDVYKRVCEYAAEHLHSLEVFDEFEPEDEGRVIKAILEIQRQLYNKAGRQPKWT